MSGTTTSAGFFGRIGKLRTGRLIVGAIILIVAAGYTWEAFEIPFGKIATPGAGLFPRVVGIAAIGIAIYVMLEATFSARDLEDEEEFELPRGKELRDVLVFFLGTLAFALLLPVLGQYIGATLYAYGIFMYLGKRAPLNWIKSAVYALILGVGVAWVFANLLQVKLPLGIILPTLLPGL